ncbi:MAG: biopolymer transporter ExbD [Candidatus Azobacteroides sp.]|nr:biopolymer transporter ExbD [Candidatus Azobacteroides sp.]
MALKRRAKIDTNFSMASMTDVIFLLLIFFMITATVVMPNTIKLNLPQSKKETSAQPLSRVMIDKDLNYYVAFGNEKEKQVTFEQITPFLRECQTKSPDMYVALYADESVQYKDIVKILDIAGRNRFKLVIATRPTD